MNKFELGQIIITKKVHPCGSNEWIVIRTGADIKIKCLKCGREVMMPTYKLQKLMKK